MKKSTKDIVEAFSNQFDSDLALVAAMQDGTVDTFVNDPDYADIIQTFANSFVNLSADIEKVAPSAKDIPKMLASVLDVKEPDRKARIAVFATVIYTMLKNLHQAGIIKIIPKHERQASGIWATVKNKIQK